MKKYEITYEYLPDPEVEIGFLEVEAEDEEQALQAFEEQCDDDVMNIKRITCYGEYVDPNQLSLI